MMPTHSNHSISLKGDIPTMADFNYEEVNAKVEVMLHVLKEMETIRKIISTQNSLTEKPTVIFAKSFQQK